MDSRRPQTTSSPSPPPTHSCRSCAKRAKAPEGACEKRDALSGSQNAAPRRNARRFELPMNANPPAAGFRLVHTDSGVAFWIHVSPRSRRPAVGGTHGDALRVAIREPPVDGAANQACVRALAGALDLRRSAVDLDPGSTGRRKRVRIEGDPAALSARLEGLAASPRNQ